jgi:UDPglucose--hexose-1-phosphate uridylyltransferase
VLRAHRARTHALAADPAIGSVRSFMNHGKGSGASQPHPHSHVVALPELTRATRTELDCLRHYHARTGECAHCAAIARERAAGERVVHENPAYLVVAPFVSLAPYELHLYPKRHMASILDGTEAELRWCAEALQVTAARVHDVLGDPPFNWYARAAQARDPDPLFHARIEFVPGVGDPSGIDLAGGPRINEVLPEDVARRLERGAST